MCGIAGWVDWGAEIKRRQTIEQMTGTLAHRGPDDAGIWLSDHAALGHRRLSVIDPAGGQQPMIRRQGNRLYIISYNGELYNTRELRAKLTARGHVFKTRCDTEVLLAAFMEWSEECLQFLNGIFAFAVWQEPKQELFLCRDRLGVKPLFYTRQGETLIFGSELKSLLAHPAVNPVLDREGLAEIFALGPGRTPGHGVFRGIAELRPGCFLKYSRQGMQIRCYWKLESKPHEDDLEDTTAKLKSLLHDAVERQLVSDVPVCTLLSGGVDSSAITAIAAETYRQFDLGPVRTFSIDYRDNEKFFRPTFYQPDSDSQWVDRVAASLNTKHTKVYIDIPQLVEALTEATLARDLPGMADVDSSLLLFCREIKKEATVALSGECADEIFGGYPWYKNPPAAGQSFPWLRSPASREELLAPELAEYIRSADYINQRYRETLEEVPRLNGESNEEARQRETSYLTLVWFMATLLDRKDRMSMASGLEIRVPFCDHRLVEYAWNIPWQMKQYSGIEKGILRHTLRGLLDNDVLYRKKSPYPKTHHPGYLQAVREIFNQIILDSSSPLKPLLNQQKARKLAQMEKDNFNHPWFGQLMTGPQLMAYLIQVNLWLQKYNVTVL